MIFPLNKKFKWYKNHPDTNTPIYGQKIPNWNDIKSTVIKLHDSLLFMPYIGWDIVLSDDEVYILEANCNPGIGLMQIISPIIKNDYTRKIFEHYKLV